jgi:hypothetical protein
LGLGINLDWSFEREFLKCAPDARLIAVDGTVSFNRLLVRAMKGVIRTGLHLARGDVDQARYAWKTSREHARTALAFRRFFSAPTRRFHGDMMRERPGAGAMTWNELLARSAADIGERGRLFVKMDIEGAEYRVLNDVLKNCDRVVGLVVEFHDCDLLWERTVELITALNASLSSFTCTATTATT